MEICFKNIESRLAELIGEAKSQIILVVPWFNNAFLFKILLEKCDKTKVTIIIENDEINKSANLNFGAFIEKGGIMYFPAKRLFHDKLCLIDNETIISGSYNWTYGAEYRNHEHIIIAYDTEIIKIAKNEVDLLIKESNLVSDYEKQSIRTVNRISDIYQDSKISIDSIEVCGELLLKYYHEKNIEEGVKILRGLQEDPEFLNLKNSELTGHFKYGVIIFLLIDNQEKEAVLYYRKFGIKGSFDSLKKCVSGRLDLYTNHKSISKSKILSATPGLIMDCYNSSHFKIGLMFYKMIVGENLDKYFSKDLALAGYIILLSNNLDVEAERLYNNSRLSKDRFLIQKLVDGKVKIKLR